MQTTHTPGPWYTMGSGVYTGSPQNDDIAHIASAHCYGVPGDPLANARLIAAAPDMLKALQLVASIWSSDQTTNVAPDSPLAIVRAAIARATA